LTSEEQKVHTSEKLVVAERWDLIEKIESEIRRIIPRFNEQRWHGSGFRSLPRVWRKSVVARKFGVIAHELEMGDLQGWLGADHCIYTYVGITKGAGSYGKVRLRRAEMWKLRNILRGLQAL
jgi:hypothetical protein